jgi:hypothetical protein
VVPKTGDWKKGGEGSVKEVDPHGMAECSHRHDAAEALRAAETLRTTEALRAAFRAAFFSIDPGDPPGAVALQREAIRLLDLRRQAGRLLMAAGAANLAEVFHDDPEMLAVLAESL